MDSDLLSSISGLSDTPTSSFVGENNVPGSTASGSEAAFTPAPMSMSPTARAVGSRPAPMVARPGDPHARLINMLGGLFLGMDAFAKAAATGGREGGVQEVQQVRANEQRLKIEQQRAERESSLVDAQIKHTQAMTNASVAQTEILKMNAPLEHQKLVIGNQAELYKLFVDTLHINPMFAVPIVEGQTTDAHMSAINQKANGDLVNNTVLPVHDDVVGGSGNSYGFSFDQLRKVNVPIEQAAPVLANLQNQINLAKGVLPDGDKDPAIQAAQGKLDVMKKGASVNGYDFFVFDNQVQAQILSRVSNQEAVQEFQKKQAEATKAKQEADPLFKLENDPNQMAGEKASAAIPMLQNKIMDPATSPEDKVRSSRLLAVANSAHQRYLNDQLAKANAEQAAKQGDPRAAGAMLASGDLTLADMKTRGMTPKFILEATAAAKAVDPKYNPADEMIAEQQAKSQSNVQFFGSANSLIAKGGTLDQLKAAGDKLPNFQLPIFNKVADYLSAASGQKELPGYSATLLGVADDYAKVMGGGQGSDTSRMAAYNSFAKDFNSGQRQAAIDAARAAVGSQVKERIGNNKFMNRIYGYALPENQPNRPKAAAFDPTKLPDAK